MSSAFQQSCVVFTLIALSSFSVSATEGYYRDIFIDGGCYLTARQSLAAAELLGLSQEALWTPYEPVTDEHRGIQTEKIVGDENDANGCLLYPDGSPRFRMIQTNGGSATRHGRSLEEEGRQRVRDFYYAGGSYTGTCAGFFISSISAEDEGVNEAYYHIWPGRLEDTYLGDAYTGMFIEPGSPLLDYYDFGGDDYVASVRHNYGGYADENDLEWPEGTEILARFDNPGHRMHEQVSCLAYKEDELSGRLVIIGSHPEGVDSGERRDLMAAMIQFTLEGQGSTQTKGVLTSGQWRTMDQDWEDGAPLFAKIGDMQYHHFVVEVPPNCPSLDIVVEQDTDYDFNLYVAYDGLAFSTTADLASPRGDESLSVEDPAAGQWHVGIENASSVTTTERDWFTEYTGNVDLLNGVAYAVMAEVGAPRRLALQLPSEVSEGEGVLVGQVEAIPVADSALEITLQSSNTERLTVPSSVTLPAGQETISFDMTPVDDSETGEAFEVTITACVERYDCGESAVTVIDDDDLPVTCAVLGGVCCENDEVCEGGTGDDSAECGASCCVGGACVAAPSGDAGSGARPDGDAGYSDATGGSDGSAQRLSRFAQVGDVPAEGCGCVSLGRRQSRSSVWELLVLCFLGVVWTQGRRRR